MITSNIRELEGALIRVTAFASLNRQPVDFSARRGGPQGPRPHRSARADHPCATIQAETAEYYALTVDDLCSSSRSRQLVTARQIAMYLCRELTELSLPKIGQPSAAATTRR
jgi:chromosomal replication initiator protein